MIRFGPFIKGWIARALPEYMPKGSLQRCDDLNFGTEGGLRVCRELNEIVSPTGISSLTDAIHAFFQIRTNVLGTGTGTSLLTYIVREGDLKRDVDNAGFADIKVLENDAYDYTSDFTEVDSGDGTIDISESTGATLTAIVGYQQGTELLYRPWSAPADFEQTFDFRCSSVSGAYTGTTCAAGVVLWAICDDHTPNIGSISEVALAVVYLSGVTISGQHRLQVRQLRGSGTAGAVATTYTGLTRMTNYYATIKKESLIGDCGRLRCAIYSDSGRTTLITNVDLSLQSGSQNYEYLIAGASPEQVVSPTALGGGGPFGSSGTSWTGRIRNLAVPLGVAGEVTRADHVVMTPELSTRKVIYIATSSGLLRDTGQSKFDSGSSWVDVGVPTPSGMSVAKLTGSGHLDAAAYKCCYTFYDSETGAESYPSSISTFTCAKNDRLKWYWSTTTTSNHASHVRLYRSIGGGGTQYYVGQVALSSGNSTSGISDSYLGSAIPDTGRPPTNATLCESWRGRLWLSGISYTDGVAAGNRIYFSRNYNPETMPPDYYLPVPESDGDVKAFAIMDGNLYILTEKGIFEVEGTTSDSFKLGDNLSHVGTCSSRSVAVGPNGIYFVGYDGIYVYKYKTKKISEQIDWLFDEGHNQWATRLVDNDLESSKGVFWDNEYIVTIGSNTLVYEEDTQRWRRRTKPFTCLWENKTTGNLYAGVSTSAYYCICEVLTDSTTGISKLYTPDFITKAEYINPPREDDEKPAPIGRLSKFKVYAKGFWTFYFYCDDTLVHTQTGTTYALSDRNKVYSLPPDIKGTTFYIRGLSQAMSGTTPGGTRFYQMEVW